MPRTEKVSEQMKQKRKSPAVVKVLACLLLLASLAMLLFPWIRLAVDTNQGRMELTEVLALVGQDKESIMNLACQGLADSGVSVPGQSLRDLLDTALDGQYSLPTLAKLCGQTGKLCEAFGEAETAQTVNMVGYGIWGLLGLLALLGLIGFCCVFTDHRGGIVPYLLLAILSMTAVILVRAGANRYLEEEGTAMLNQWGVGMITGFFGIDIHIVKMGISAYLCPVLALLALLLMGIRKKQPAPSRKEPVTPYPARKDAKGPAANEQTAAPAAPEGWTCPNCGSVRTAGENFCGICGTERPKQPEPRCCPVCGRPVKPGDAFCRDCGAKL